MAPLPDPVFISHVRLATPTSPTAELLNLAKLRAFTIVVEHGSGSRAAALLFRAQSAVTRSVRDLEETLGEQLLERHPSGMLPTPVGRAVDHRSRRTFAELHALAQWCATRQAHARAFTSGSIPSYLLNTRRLQLFVALVHYQHIPSAAQALRVSQPAVSSAVQILENGADIALFDRTARGVQLTHEGEIFALFPVHIRIQFWRTIGERRPPEDVIDIATWDSS